jgi:hypothetical protein
MRIRQVSCACPGTCALRDEPRRAGPVTASATQGPSGSLGMDVEQPNRRSRHDITHHERVLARVPAASSQQTAINLLGPSFHPQVALWRQYTAPRHQKLTLRRPWPSSAQNRLAAVALLLSLDLRLLLLLCLLACFHDTLDPLHLILPTPGPFYIFSSPDTAQPLRTHHAPWPSTATIINMPSPAP